MWDAATATSPQQRWLLLLLSHCWLSSLSPEPLLLPSPELLRALWPLVLSPQIWPARPPAPSSFGRPQPAPLSKGAAAVDAPRAAWWASWRPGDHPICKNYNRTTSMGDSKCTTIVRVTTPVKFRGDATIVMPDVVDKSFHEHDEEGINTRTVAS